eukprot:756389-Prorocentrum_lima.AAC.1
MHPSPPPGLGVGQPQQHWQQQQFLSSPDSEYGSRSSGRPLPTHGMGQWHGGPEGERLGGPRVSEVYRGAK